MLVASSNLLMQMNLLPMCLRERNSLDRKASSSVLMSQHYRDYDDTQAYENDDFLAINQIPRSPALLPMMSMPPRMDSFNVPSRINSVTRNPNYDLNKHHCLEESLSASSDTELSFRRNKSSVMGLVRNSPLLYTHNSYHKEDQDEQCNSENH